MRAAVLLGFFLTFMSAHSQTVELTTSPTTTLATLRGTVRPLLIFSPTGDDTRLRDQLHILAVYETDARERQVTPVVIAAQGNAPASAVHLSPAEAAQARQRFRVPPAAFTVVLLGKDGGPKLRATHPLPIEQLRSTIDSMPMRQDEMKHETKPPSN